MIRGHVNDPHLEHGDVSTKVDGVATGVCRVYWRAFTDGHREEEDLVGATVLGLVENLHEIEKLLRVIEGNSCKGENEEY